MIKSMLSFAAIALSLAVVAAPTAADAGSYGNKDYTTKAAATAAPTADIVDTAVGAGQFTSLVAAVQAAGLVDTLKGPGPFTVFAPTDEAFAKLGNDTVAELLKPENKDQLTAILTYHVIPGKVVSADLAGKQLSPATVQGTTVDVDATGAAVKVDGASVVKADIMTTNGVIHVIDSVITP